MKKQNPASKAFLIAVLVSVVLPFIPFARYILLPFDYLNTHLHEMFHAIAGVITAAQIEQIQVFGNGEGVTLTRGGFGPLISSAGYVGASLFGAWMIRSCHNVENSVKWIRILGILVLASNILWVRGDAIGWPMGLLWGIGLLVAVKRVPKENVVLLAQFLGVQQCVNGFKALRDLIYLSSTGEGMNDAVNMAQETHVPSIAWAVLWMGISLYGVIMAVLALNRTSRA